MSNYFQTLNDINVNDKIEEKNKLSYLSWAWAWAEIKKAHANANYTIYKNAQGWNYHTDGRTCWVEVSVTVEGIEHIEHLPVMNHMNKSIAADAVTSFDVNKSIQRCLTKAIARHGLGLYIYAGEDLPESEEDKKPTPKAESKPTPKAEPKPKTAEQEFDELPSASMTREQRIEKVIAGTPQTIDGIKKWLAGKNQTIEAMPDAKFKELLVALEAKKK